MIENGRQVSIEYTLKLEDGTVVQSNVGEKPLTYEQGAGQILPAIERALAGLAAEDRKELTLQPEEGYGPVNPSAFDQVDVGLIPEDARHVGALLVAEDQSGNQRRVRVHEVHDDHIVLDFNHPLAGRTLHFDLRVVAVA